MSLTMIRIGFLTGCIALALGCASPADRAQAELGRGECAKRAIELCEESLERADPVACQKRETYLCEAEREIPK